MLTPLLLVVSLAPGFDVPPPSPWGPIPSARQLAWQELELYAFVHFNMNTFTGREWGDGTEEPARFAPTELDCRQWASVCRRAGMAGIIITAKHHDGFCLWPSRFTRHTVAHSPWRDGHGDVLKELSEACRELGLRFGVYLSPWDRNHPDYGNSPVYNDHFKNQLREVLTGYGEVFEVWFDGACGEGANGKRQVYDWPGFVEVVRTCQPRAVIFSDAGPDVRWVGNEKGYADSTCWSLLRRDEVYPGYPRYTELTSGHPDGTHWVPAECDVSIRPGWYYHADQDSQVKSLEQLLEIYYRSVGHNGSLLLNLPVDRRGLVPETDAARLLELRAALDQIFERDLARARATSASNVRGRDPVYAGAKAVDGEPLTYWATDDDVTQASLTIELGAPVVFDHVVVREPIALGQRIESFSIDAFSGESWTTVGRGTTIGNKRILRLPATRAERVRLNVLRSRASPLISVLEVFAGPPRVRIEAESFAFVEPVVVKLTTDHPHAAIRYTLDGSRPGSDSPLYSRPLSIASTTVLTAVAWQGGRRSLWVQAQEFRHFSHAELAIPARLGREPLDGLEYSYYEGSWRGLDEMAKTPPERGGVIDDLRIDFARRKEHFGVEFRGYFEVPSDGVYTFHLTSDDGSRLYLGGRLVIDNDGWHGMVERSAPVGLRAGFHLLRVTYFNQTGDSGLVLEVSGGGYPRQRVPRSHFYR